MAPRDHRGAIIVTSPRHCERSEAIQEPRKKDWIASSRELLAMTELAILNHPKLILLQNFTVTPEYSVRSVQLWLLVPLAK
jgi:hypothetical protein